MDNCPVGIFINNHIIPPLHYSKIKTGKGLFLSGLTYGITKISSVNEYKNKEAKSILNIGDTIVFKFGDVPLEYMQTMWEFSPTNSPNDFGIGKFQVKKKTRELKTGEVSIWTGYESGTKQTTDVTLSPISSSNGEYVFIITKAEPGEYCFMFTNNAAGGYLPIFDFSVRKK